MTAVLTVSAQQIVFAALRLVGKADASRTPDAPATTDTLEALNFLVKSYQNQGLHLWSKTEGVLFLQKGKTNYFMGPGGDEAANQDDFINTEMAVAGSASDLTITLDSTAGMTINDNIGIRLDDGTRQWTTVRAISLTVSGQVTLQDALTGAAAIDNSVFTFTDLIPRPIRILQLRRDRIGASSEELESDQWSREEYFAQPDKLSQGDLVNWYYTPELTKGRIYVWQTANDVDQIARFTYERPLEITDDIDESTDFPSEWFRTLKYNLAVDIAPEYKIKMDRLLFLQGIAVKLLGDSLGFDNENDSMSLQPDLGG